MTSGGAFDEVLHDFSHELRGTAFDMMNEFRDGKRMTIADFATALRAIDPGLTDAQVMRLFSYGMHATR